MNKKLLQKYSQVFPTGSAGIHTPRLLKERRTKLLKHLDSLCFFQGVPHEPGAENIWVMNGLRIFQEPSMMYLTGINQAQVILALNPLKKPHETLFIAKKNEAREFWDGVRFGYDVNKSSVNTSLKELTELTGIQNILPMDDFHIFFKEAVKSLHQKHIYCFYHAYQKSPEDHSLKRITTDHNWAFYKKLKTWARQNSSKPITIRSMADLHFKLRLPLDKYQQKDVKKAIRLTNLGFIRTLKRLKGFTTEHEVANFLEYAIKEKSPYGLSFPTIAASGKNATILHYLKNDEKLSPGSLLLLDFGVRVGTMHADISRTIPLNGKFNPLQKLLYNIVLSALKFTQKRAVMGTTIRKLNQDVWEFLEEQLQIHFIAKGGKFTRSYTLQPHGVSHLMGEQEHDGDPFKLYQDLPLQENWQISNEPGLYGHFSMKIKGKLYSQAIGIRIEDNLLITPKGALCLSKDIPKETGEIEALIGSK